ncbi:MAG: copper-binding protein [Roseovarius sp.]
MTQSLLRRSAMFGMAAAAVIPFRAGLAGTSIVHDVTIKAFRFVPETIIAKPGDIIRWTNQDIAPHTATADDFSWDTGELAYREQAELIVTADMLPQYFCAFHTHMAGTVTLD